MIDPNDKPVRLTLVPEASTVPSSIRLRRLLKLALRTFGFRCVRVEDAPDGADQAVQQPPANGAGKNE